MWLFSPEPEITQCQDSPGIYLYYDYITGNVFTILIGNSNASNS